ncbi:MarR family winged helix-turn-helix transcriptional regulator [Sphingomonas canadensis]|uniref:MarR family winged helix-turn-helix transcriptional regulator n=1 Tax=Sphingomonas canadensis TaxID=1219257 RepID=A0ABW3H774_9SPHN|nr:MarR family transcriptional regulator [Sphingomonas canadensis]MCW3837007.1 MarR family transcriptional regulator [Sphingomonas canadensis]
MSLTRLTAMPGHLIRRAQQVSTAIFAEELADAELTSVQLISLAAIAERPGLDATTLAELIDFDKATIGGVLDRLERKGLVRRSVSPSDKRVKELAATPAGRALLAASMPAAEQVQVRLLAPLSPAEREDFLRMLRLVTAASQD